MSICIRNCVRCNWLWCFGNTEIQSAVDSPHKRPLILCLGVLFGVSLSKLLKQQSICWCWKTSSCVISYIFSLKSKVYPEILKFPLLKQQSICWCWKTSSCVISYIFSLKSKVHPKILKFLREINYDNNLINFSLRRYILSSSLLGRTSRT